MTVTKLMLIQYYTLILQIKHKHKVGILVSHLSQVRLNPKLPEGTVRG